jgi:FixJ family two-component response regulator
MTGLELQQQLNVRGWRIPVIFITGHGTVSLAIAAMKAGAFDFIEKPLREDALLESIERALHWNDRAYEERLERATLEVRVALLTPREREVFELVAAEPNKVIARHLAIQLPYRRAASRPDHREIASTQHGRENSPPPVRCGIGRITTALHTWLHVLPSPDRSAKFGTVPADHAKPHRSDADQDPKRTRTAR